MPGIKPEAVVIVATIRALKMHGGVAKDQLKEENVDALAKVWKTYRSMLKQFKASVCLS